MKLTVIILILTLPSYFLKAQKKDFLITNTRDTILCEVIGIKGCKVKFKKDGSLNTQKENIFCFSELNLEDVSVINNPLNFKFTQPEPGFAHIYLYRPYAYEGSASGMKVYHNGGRLVNLKLNSYYLHKVKANRIHKYNIKLYRKHVVEIEAKDGGMYFVRGSYATFWLPWNWAKNLGKRHKLFLDNPKVAKYAILTMKKESKKY